MNTEFLTKLLKQNAISGREHSVRELIAEEIAPFAEISYDGAGNLIAFCKGKKRADKRLMIDAHMDEVGFIVTYIRDDGLICFDTVGGINRESVVGKRVRIGNVNGVIGIKPVHLCSKEEKEKYPEVSSLYIDIGAKDKKEAKLYVTEGDAVYFNELFFAQNGKISSKALDDRIGCAVLTELIKSEHEYDFYASFSTGEEVGLRGARAAAYGIDPQFAIVLEATTAADIKGADSNSRVCALGNGPVISFMDKATVYDRALYNAAFSLGIQCQPKTMVAGGNNSGAIHLSKSGVRTIAISVGCRYIHSAVSVADISDISAAAFLVEKLANRILSEDI